MVLLALFTGTGIVAFLVTLLLLAVIIYGISLLFGMMNLPENIKKLAWLVVGICVILYLLNRFGGGLGV